MCTLVPGVVRFQEPEQESRHLERVLQHPERVLRHPEPTQQHLAQEQKLAGIQALAQNPPRGLLWGWEQEPAREQARVLQQARVLEQKPAREQAPKRAGDQALDLGPGQTLDSV